MLTVTLWVKKNRRGKKVEIFWHTLQISDYGCFIFQFCPYTVPKLGYFSPYFCIFGRKISDKNFTIIFQEPKNLQGLLPCHDMTARCHWGWDLTYCVRALKFEIVYSLIQLRTRHLTFTPHFVIFSIVFCIWYAVVPA